jgi:hypothetical protein
MENCVGLDCHVVVYAKFIATLAPTCVRVYKLSNPIATFIAT